MSDVTFGKTEPRSVPGSGLWGQNSPFSSLSFLEGKKGAAGQRQGERRGHPPSRGEEVRVRFEGCRRWELALPKGARGAGTPSAGGGDASSVPLRQSREELGAHRAAGAGHPGPSWGGRSMPLPLGTPGDSAARNGPAKRAGEALLGFAAFALNANEIPLPSLIPGAVRRRGARAPGPARPPRPRGRQRLGRSLDGGHHVAAPGAPARPPGPREETRGIYARSPGRCGCGTGAACHRPPGGTTRSPAPPLCCRRRRHSSPFPPTRHPLISSDSSFPAASFPWHWSR